MKLSEYREDLTMRKNGAPIAVSDATFYVRRFGTPESNEIIKQLRQQIYGPLHKMQDGDELAVYAHWLTDYGVTGWEGVLNEDDSALEYSQQAARKIFTNPEYQMSLNMVLISASAAFENYLHEESDKDLETLKKK